MNEQYLKNIVEAALLAAGRPLALDELAAVFGERERPELAEIRVALDALAAEYTGRALELKEVSSGFRLQIRSQFTEPVSRLWQERPRSWRRWH
jgi:segregation and condensation protein B